MPRALRIHYPNAIYHVMLRGNYQQTIFFDEKDKLYFFQLLEKSIQKYGFQMHLYCLMTNHIHMVIEVSHVPLSKIIQSIAAGYARFINKSRLRSGHLFQGRYKAKLVQDEEYLLELCYYIHRNPLMANMVDNIDDYKWSSHLAYKDETAVNWLTTDYINQLLKNQINFCDRPYDAFMKDRKNQYQKPAFCNVDKDGMLVILDSVNKKISKKEQLIGMNLKLKTIAEVICEHMKMDWEDLVSEKTKRRHVLTRSLVAIFAHYYAGYYLKDVALLLARDPGALSRSLHKTLEKASSDKTLSRLIHFLECQFLEIVRSD